MGAAGCRRAQYILWRWPVAVIAVSTVMPDTCDPQCLEHVLRIVAAGPVGCDPQTHTTPEHVVKPHASAAELAVACRIVDDDGAPRRDSFDVVIRQPDA